MKQEEPKPIVVFTGEIFEATYIKNMLEDYGILTAIQNKNVDSIAPWQVGEPYSVNVIISSLDYEPATTLIENFNNNEIVL